MSEFRFNYDNHADVLYISTERNGPSYAREDKDGVIWRYLVTDDSLVGVTLLNFEDHWKDNLSDLMIKFFKEIGCFTLS